VAFPSDTLAYQQVGPLPDEAAVGRVHPGGVIGAENLSLLQNAHRGWTQEARARLCELSGPPASTEGAATAWAETSSLVNVVVAGDVPLARAEDRPDWTVYVDAENADVTTQVVDGAGVVIDGSLLTFAGARAQQTDALTVPTALATNLFLRISLASLDGNPCYLYALRIYEDNTTT